MNSASKQLSSSLGKDSQRTIELFQLAGTFSHQPPAQYMANFVLGSGFSGSWENFKTQVPQPLWILVPVFLSFHGEDFCPEFVDASSLKVLKTRLDRALSSLVQWVAREVDDLESPFQHKPFCCSMIFVLQVHWAFHRYSWLLGTVFLCLCSPGTLYHLSPA